MNNTPLELYVKNIVDIKIMEDKGRSFGIHASSISGPCMRKVWYELQGIPAEYSRKAKGRMKLGTAVHNELILNSKSNEVTLTGDVRNMKKIRFITEKNMFDCIAARSDDFILYNDNVIILDKKTTTSRALPFLKTKGPSEEYIFQLNEYALLLNIKSGVKVEKGVIVYLCVDDALESYNFEIPLWPLETTRKLILEKLDKVDSETAPDRVITGRCEGCPFKSQSICNPTSIPNYQELVKIW